MTREAPEARLAKASEQFDRHESRRDGERVVRSLDAGLNVLRDLFYERMHVEVELMMGTDSMLVPLSEAKTQRQTKQEIDVYQAVESACAVRKYEYVNSPDDWYLQWLGRHRLEALFSEPKTVEQLQRYQSATADERRLALMDTLLRVLPESRQAPLVLFRLAPLSVQLATAMAFSDPRRANELRRQQQDCLPAIADCRQCHGKVLENGDVCRVCGNPLWKFQWLTVTD